MVVGECGGGWSFGDVGKGRGEVRAGAGVVCFLVEGWEGDDYGVGLS